MGGKSSLQGQKKNKHNALIRRSEGKIHLGDLEVDERMTLQRNLKL
jgi:hypothetical protein